MLGDAVVVGVEWTRSLHFFRDSALLAGACAAGSTFFLWSVSWHFW